MRMRRRWASSSLFSFSNHLSRSCSSASIFTIALAIRSALATYWVAGKICVRGSSRRFSPVIGSITVSRSTVSPNISMRSTVSSYDGCTSIVSPRTRKRPRPSTASLRSNCRSTSRRRMLRMS